MSARYDFRGRTALITGGAGGIGTAVARTLQSGGARVATFDSRAADLDAVLAIDGDVRRSEDIDAAVARVVAELGPLDIAVCAAGTARSRPELLSTTVETRRFARGERPVTNYGMEVGNLIGDEIVRVLTGESGAAEAMANAERSVASLGRPW